MRPPTARSTSWRSPARRRIAPRVKPPRSPSRGSDSARATSRVAEFLDLIAAHRHFLRRRARRLRDGARESQRSAARAGLPGPHRPDHPRRHESRRGSGSGAGGSRAARAAAPTRRSRRRRRLEPRLRPGRFRASITAHRRSTGRRTSTPCSPISACRPGRSNAQTSLDILSITGLVLAAGAVLVGAVLKGAGMHALLSRPRRSRSWWSAPSPPSACRRRSG